jgi:hypothetical protein
LILSPKPATPFCTEKGNSYQFNGVTAMVAAKLMKEIAVKILAPQ